MLHRISSFLFRNSSPRQTVAKNTVWLFMGELVGRALRVCIIIYAARVLGVAEYGIFSYAVTLAALCSIFADIGVGAIVTKEGVRNPDQLNAYASTSFVIKLSLTLCAVVLLALAYPLITRAMPEVQALIPFIALLIIFDSVRDFGLSFNRVFERMEREAYIKIITNALIAGLGVIFLLRASTGLSLITAYAIGSGASLIPTAWALRGHLKNLFCFFSRSLVLPILTSAWPIALMGILGGIMVNTDMLMIGWLIDEQAVGLYAVAERIIQMLYAFPALLAGALFPVFARSARKNNQAFRKAIEESLSAIYIVALPLVLGGIIVARNLISFVFGAEYVDATTSFQILLLTLIVAFPLPILSNALFAYDKQRHFSSFLAIGAIGNIILNFMLIHPFGIVGCAIGTLIIQTIVFFLAIKTMQQENTFSIRHRLLSITIAGVVMATATFAMESAKIPLAITIILSMLIYLLMLIFLKEPLLTSLYSMIRSGQSSPGMSSNK